MKTTLFLGPPGTGKTHRLLSEIESRLAGGLHPDRLAYVAFTRKAAEEAMDRGRNALGQPKRMLRNFRTIHSMAYRQLELGDGDILVWEDYRELGDSLGLRFSKYYDPEEAGVGTRTEGDQVRAVSEYAAATCQDAEAVRHEMAPDLDVWKLRRYLAALRMYKLDCDKMDFNDLLAKVTAIPPLDIDVAIVDEAQDLSQLQWRAVRHMFSNASEIMLAGDDDQAIFRWAGADVPTFLSLKATRVILGQSRRVPKAVQGVALDIVRQIRSRYEKDWAARDAEGSVQRVGAPEDIDLHNGGSWLLLARNNYLLDLWETACRNAGVVYMRKGRPSANPKHLRGIRAWEAMRHKRPVKDNDAALAREYASSHAKRLLDEGAGPIWFEALLGIPARDAEYYRAALRRGEDLDSFARITLSTIHGAKGGEADHVALLTDRSSGTATAAEHTPDDEHRVFYVAVTRARETLTLVAPQAVAATSYVL